MTRAAFNTTCDLVRGPNHVDAGDRYATCACRFVLERTEVPGIEPLQDRVAYVTLESFRPTEPSVVMAAETAFTDYGDADRIAIPAGGPVLFSVLWVEEVIWRGQLRYWRAMVRMVSVLPFLGLTVFGLAGEPAAGELVVGLAGEPAAGELVVGLEGEPAAGELIVGDEV